MKIGGKSPVSSRPSRMWDKLSALRSTAKAFVADKMSTEISRMVVLQITKPVEAGNNVNIFAICLTRC